MSGQVDKKTVIKDLLEQGKQKEAFQTKKSLMLSVKLNFHLNNWKSYMMV